VPNIEYVKGQTSFAATTTYSGGALPIDADSFFMSEGGGVVDQNPDALDDVDFTRVEMRGAFSADVGSPGSPFEFDCNQGGAGIVVLASRSANLYLAGGDGGVWYDVTMDMQLGTARVFISAVSITGVFKALRGVARFSSTAALDAADLSGPCTVICDAHGSDTIGNVRVSNGATLIVRRRIAGTVLLGEGGTVVYDVDTGTATGLITMAGGRLDHRKGSLAIYGMKGEYDYRQLERAATTAGAAYTVTLEEFEGLVEMRGIVSPSFTRTLRGKGSRKIT
jgi:hypothetical protein